MDYQPSIPTPTNQPRHQRQRRRHRTRKLKTPATNPTPTHLTAAHIFSFLRMEADLEYFRSLRGPPQRLKWNTTASGLPDWTNLVTPNPQHSLWVEFEQRGHVDFEGQGEGVWEGGEQVGTKDEVGAMGGGLEWRRGGEKARRRGEVKGKEKERENGEVNRRSGSGRRD
ncbi:hypothetical protein P280DRAFT_512635 [Massarina eburnea CBS 473.64]|uniref:Uncharacterized protein n=1 Tax=Massarina eburnea CBS 473.64 TaxID=1395130 RepID=A0A6A6SHJ6_9PLEO|nr:hypothetical protein P280DRAFT_512635 [Massarina eburnea CBS 473.64]